MKIASWLSWLILLSLLAGCNSDIVCTEQLKSLEYKCIFLEPIDSQDPYVGQVLRDVLEKEFVRRKVQICDANSANVFLAGSTFLTSRVARDTGIFNSRKYAPNQAIESVSVVAKDPNGQILLTASYDNNKQYTASKLAKEFGQALAQKLK